MSVTPLPKSALILSAATAAVALGAGAWTLADPGLLHGPAAMQGSARGTALVLLCVALPVLGASMLGARSGSSAAVVTWGSALLYTVYNAVLFLFLTPFNTAFLLYVAMLGLSVWSVGALVAGIGIESLGSRFSPQAPVRPVAVYLWVVAGLNALAWLAAIVPALDDAYPQKLLAGTGVQTNAIYVQDLALWLPLAAVAGYWLYQREARGLVVGSALLGMWVIESLSVAVDQWMGHTADPTSTVVSSGVVLPFLVLAAVGLVPAWLMLRDMRPLPTSVPVRVLAAPGGSAR